MAPTNFRYFLLINANEVDTVYPMVYDESGSKVIWDGSSSSGNDVHPGKQLRTDITTVVPTIADQTIVILGSRVVGSGIQAKDMDNPRTFVSTSPNTAVGTHKANGRFSVDPAAVAGLDTASFQDAYLKVNNPAVAKLLVSIANLISPELA